MFSLGNCDMADLDDFFAKKDKKKSKTKKFLTAEELAKQLEDTSKRSAEPPKPKKERPASSAGGGEGEDSSNSDQVSRRQDDEWKEFEEEERKDYSGLKLAQLTISEDNQNNSGQDGDGGHDGSSDGEGNTVHSDRRHTGPWKKVVDESSQQIQEPEPPQPQPVLQKSSKYVSPAFRGQMSQRPVKLRNKDAPDITNEEYFPTLGAARPEEQRKKKNEPAFEEVRHGSRVTRIQEVQQSAPVSVGNRFRSLADDDS